MTPEQDEALRSLAAVWSEHRLFVVGASALVFVQRMPTDRVTLDIDLAIDAAMGELKATMQASPDWSPVRGREHRWAHRAGALVDLLPIGGSHLEDGVLVWPESGARMNLAGFDLLASNSRGLEQAGHPRIEVPSAALIAMLKMLAWLDRPQERMRDLHDLAYLFDHYLDPLDDRLFLGEAARLELHDERANIYLLGFDIGSLSTAGPAEAVERFLRRVRAHVPAQVALARRWPSVDDEEGALKRLMFLEMGCAEGCNS